MRPNGGLVVVVGATPRGCPIFNPGKTCVGGVSGDAERDAALPEPRPTCSGVGATPCDCLWDQGGHSRRRPRPRHANGARPCGVLPQSPTPLATPKRDEARRAESGEGGTPEPTYFLSILTNPTSIACPPFVW